MAHNLSFIGETAETIRQTSHSTTSTEPEICPQVEQPTQPVEPDAGVPHPSPRTARLVRCQTEILGLTL
ncbi:MAG: hypothetical protein NTZ32_25825 [Planctomycetales bacterium]|nr:hypothetical protein [Planctomycetales bacterium]